MKIRTIIVDDEPHAIEVIGNYLRKFTEIELVATCGDAIQAFQLLQQKQVDLMFLDIKMPGLTGTELLRNLKNPPKVIFTTAYMEYAVEGFELDAVDYLLKPVSFDRFIRAIDKVFKQHQIKTNVSISAQAPLADKNIFLYLKVDRKMIKLNVEEILWVESLKDYIKVVTRDRTMLSKQKISVLEELLPADKFVRIHRSFIIPVDKIASYYSHCVEIGDREIPIGRNYKMDLQRKLTFRQ
ncbi:LytR/AlgR family response regulator transcription factor [Hufsiella ginkgonis]|uniref:Response regulator n=1 Tax=Hufsiella ginkgonis TaxID=2695274 RepID=A0A7K1Y1Z3_9SPHI|nr:response regulator transcription factor [Hufsiella ginkgonis]MXV17202.1 response regulator [Hufsiella ginkgonis]